MRRRILCLVLLGLLVAPALGWARSVELDPNGQPSAEQGAATPSDVQVENASERLVAAVSSLWDVLLERLERLNLLF